MKIFFISIRTSIIFLLVVLAVIVSEHIGMMKWEIFESLKTLLSRILGGLIALCFAPPLFIFIEKLEVKILNRGKETKTAITTED